MLRILWLGSLVMQTLLQMRMQGLLRTAIHHMQHRCLVIGLKAFRIQVVQLTTLTSQTSKVSCMWPPCNLIHGEAHEFGWLW